MIIDNLFSIIIDNAAARRLERGAYWLSERDVVGCAPRLPGIARVLDRRRRFLAMAFCSPGSRQFLRVIAWEECPIDRAFWEERVRRADERRRQLAAETDAYRVVYSEADGIPGVVIDRYNDLLAFQITAAGAESIKAELVAILIDAFHPAAIIEKDDLAVRQTEGLPLVERVVYGSKSQTLVREGECRFEVDVLAGQKTGAYLDYRAFRLKAREFAQGDCLDAFCYQGWFACQIAQGVHRVVAIDSSEAALDAARRNAMLNGRTNIEFVRRDAFEHLAAHDQRFDFIHLDPPAMAKERGAMAAAVRGYRKLVGHALAHLNDRGVLMVSSCSHKISERILEEAVLEVITKAGRGGTVLWRGIQDCDHPVVRGLPESLYLKAIAVRVAA
jgi:23S rRNA (cytosine1962-C5)-methyltransferase